VPIVIPLTLILFAATGLACGAAPGTSSPGAQSLMPAYNQETGRLEQLTSDRNTDGRVDTWAYMDGGRLERVEIDRDGDGAVDRVEHYETSPDEDGGAGSLLERAIISHAEEMTGPEPIVVRREFYERGVLDRVEEDTNADGKVNRWETYEGGTLTRMDLDLQGKGFPDRRLFYTRGGIQRVEVDPEGDGVFRPLPASGMKP
jgi:hypothetical protein